MGLLDFMKGDDKKKVERLGTTLKEPYAQPEVRQEAMEDLFKLGTHDAYKQVLKRFTFLAQSLHWDSIEKKWLMDELAKTGAPAVGAVKEFIMTDDNLNLAIRALERMVPEKETRQLILDALKGRSPEDYRRTQAKLELIDHLGSRPVDAELWATVLPYLEDHSDDVRMKLLEAIDGWKHVDAAPEVAKLLADDTLSARVHRMAAQVVSDLGVALKPAPTLPPAAAEDFQLDADGKLVRRKRS